MSLHRDTAAAALCNVLEAYTPRTWWQAILRALLLRACKRHLEISR